MNPRYAWSLNEPLRCIETVMGNGDMFRTGELAGAGVSTSTREEAKLIPIEEVLEKRKKNTGYGAISIWPGAIQLPQAGISSPGNYGYCHLGVSEM